MDPVCHTLVGAALAEAGLRRRTALATATLIVGANAPDIDILSVPFGYNLEFRRGLTHGVLAMVVLPLVVVTIMLAWDRLVRRRGGRMPEVRADSRQLLLLAFLAVLTHPLLDILNTYGVRLLMPFAGTWFEGDALFIVDPWVLIALGVAITSSRLVARRRARAAHHGRQRNRTPLFTAPARAALALVFLYAAGMLAANYIARAHVRADLRARGIGHDALMVEPVPVNPLLRNVVVESGDSYLLGTFTWLPRRFVLDRQPVPRNARHAAVREAAATPEGRRFLAWSRFPYFVIDEGEGATRVHMADLRYATDPRNSWAARTIVIGQ